MNASNYVISLGRKNMSFKTTAQLAALLLSTALFTACGNGDAETSTNDPSATTSTFDLGRRIEKLASDEFQGRAPSTCLLYTSPSPRDLSTSRMPSSA